MLKKMTTLSALLALILVDLLKAQGTPVTPVLETTSVEQSRDPSIQPSTELPLPYSRDPYKEEGTEQVGNNGVQEGEQATWELSGEPSTEPTPEPSMDPSKEPTQESTTEISE
ncbi:diacylglycerol kinase kappa-like [Pezoporus occidentalis]|uniref:diacylglycerol kinase kappa-like n=1 Tax=Pezoporus occidentalis TaxID=407982 RepID=UPI002F916CA6